jgi:ketosteroid isomerase-like protein
VQATKACAGTAIDQASDMDKEQIERELKPIIERLTHFSEAAQSDAFLRCYADTNDFVAVSGDGIIRDYQGFKKICQEYYESLQEQKISTTHEIIHVLDDNTVVLTWSGNIDAYFKNGDKMKMENYAVTFLFKKLTEGWKVIHSHESALPAPIIKSG